MVNNFDYEGIEYSVSKSILARLNKENNICMNIFCCENDLIYPVCVSNEKFENCIDLLLITDENKSHYVYIEEFNRFMCNKTKDNNKKHFFKYCLQCFTSKRVLIEHKENCLIINSKQSETISCTI